MRAVFFGTPELAVPSLARAAERHEVVAVVCQPDKPQGRSGTPTPPPVKVWAVEHGIPVHQPTKLNDGTFEAWLKEQRPDVGLMAAYGRLLKQPILDVPPLGWLNVHPSLLPRWRGPSPIQTAILAGDAETGVTIMRVILAMDAGDIVLQQRTPIGPDETSQELSDRLALMGADMLVEAMGLVEQGNAPATPQDPEQVVFCSMFSKEDGRIRWDGPAWRIHNRVRASIPWPVAQCLYGGEVCRILKTAPVDIPADAPPGTVTQVLKDRVLVATGEGQLAILRFQAPGKKAMDMAAFLLGRRMEPGERFEEIH